MIRWFSLCAFVCLLAAPAFAEHRGSFAYKDGDPHLMLMMEPGVRLPEPAAIVTIDISYPGPADVLDAQGNLLTTGAGVWFVPSGGGSGSSTAAIVTHAQGPSTEGDALTTLASGTTTCSNYTVCFPMPDAILSHNGVVFSYRYHATSQEAGTATDDQSNTYTCISEVHDSGNNFWMGACYSLNLTNSPRMIKLTLNSGCGASGCTDVQIIGAGQCYNCTAFDTSSTNLNSATTTLSAGALTTAQTFDVVYQSVSITGTKNTSSTNNVMPTITFGSGWNGVAADPRDGASDQWQNVSSAGSVTPTETSGSSVTALSVAVAFKTGSQGTLPSGEYVVCRGSYNSEEGSALSPAVQMPCGTTGNLIHAGLNGGLVSGTATVTSVTDSTNTWANCQGTTGGDNGFATSWYAANATLSNTEKGTFNITWTGTGDVSVWWDVVSGASSLAACGSGELDNFTTAATGSTVNYSTTFQPQASASLNFLQGGVATNTNIGATSPCTNFDAVISGGENQSGPWQEDQNNPRAHCASTGNAKQTWTASLTSSTLTVEAYTGIIDSYPTPTAVWAPQQVNCQSTANSLTCAITQKSSSDSLVAIVGSFNSTARTLTSLCNNGATCGAGHAMTCDSGSHATNGSGGAAYICHWFSTGLSGAQTFTATWSGTVSNDEVSIYEVANISAVATVSAGSNPAVTNSSASQACPSVTPNVTPTFIASGIVTSNAINTSPASGSLFTDKSGIWSNTTDAWQAEVTTATTAQTPAYTGSGTTGCNVEAFK